MAKKFRYKHILSSIEDRVPSDLLEGEIAVNSFNGKEKLFIKNSNEEIVSFIPEHNVVELISAMTIQIEVLTNNLRTLSIAIGEDLDEYEFNINALSAGTVQIERSISGIVGDNIEQLSGSVISLSSSTENMGYNLNSLSGSVTSLSSSTRTNLNNLSNSLNTLSGSVTALSSTTVALSAATHTRINNEETRAQSAETILRNDLDTLAIASTEEHDELKYQIDYKTATLAESIENEATRAMSAETIISSHLDTLAIATTQEIANIGGSFSAETVRAMSAETMLGEAIEAEETRAMSAETILSGSIKTIGIAAVEEMSTLGDALSAETVRAASAETIISSHLDTLAIASTQEMGNISNSVSTLSAGTFTTFNRKPVTIWETDGTTGLSGVNDSTMNLNSWQLENLDFSQYSYIKCYIKQADVAASSAYSTPSVVVFVPLDDASKSSQYNAYIGGGGATNMNDRDIHFQVLCAVDSTKTKFKVLSEHSVAGTILGERNGDGRYCYKIVGYYE